MVIFLSDDTFSTSLLDAHAIYLLNLLLAFLQPKFDPSLQDDLLADDIEGGGEEIVEAAKLGLVDEDEGCEACDDCTRADARDAAAISALRLSHTLT